MPIQASPVLPTTIAALAVSLALSTLPAVSAPANTAETCLPAPKGAAPQGSHWRYRLEQGRKCWRLVQVDQKRRSAATQPDPQGDVDDEEADSVAKPAAKKPAGRVTEPAPKPAPALASQYTSDTAATTPPVPWPEPPAEMMQRQDAPSAPAPLEQTQNDTPAQAAQTPAPMAEPPVQQPVAATDNAAPATASGGASTLQFVFAVIAFVGILICAIFCIASARRRRTDVLRKAQHLNALPTEVPTAPDAPTFAPLPPMSLLSQHDDVEEAMQRFAERWKRRAA